MTLIMPGNRWNTCLPGLSFFESSSICLLPDPIDLTLAHSYSISLGTMCVLNKGHSQSVSNQNPEPEVPGNLWVVVLVGEGIGVLWGRGFPYEGPAGCGGERDDTPDREVLLEDVVLFPDG